MFISAPVLHTVAALLQSFHICMVKLQKLSSCGDGTQQETNHLNSHLNHLCVNSFKNIYIMKIPTLMIISLRSPLKRKHLKETVLLTS